MSRRTTVSACAEPLEDLADARVPRGPVEPESVAPGDDRLGARSERDPVRVHRQDVGVVRPALVRHEHLSGEVRRRGQGATDRCAHDGRAAGPGNPQHLLRRRDLGAGRCHVRHRSGEPSPPPPRPTPRGVRREAKFGRYGRVPERPKLASRRKGCGRADLRARSGEDRRVWRWIGWRGEAAIDLPVQPMLAKAVKRCPRPTACRRPGLRAEVGRLPMPGDPGRRRGRAGQPRQPAADPILPRGRRERRSG